MLHALIIDLGTPRLRTHGLRASLEARGWETSTFHRPALPRGPDALLLHARWIDCHLAVVLHAPGPLIHSLQQRAPRAILQLSRPGTWGRHARVLA